MRTRAELTALKKALMSKVWLTKDPLVARKEFTVWIQQEGETVNIFTGDLKLLLSQAYPLENLTPGIQLQQFLTGLLPSFSLQLLLQWKPTSFKQAVKDTEEIEHALSS